MSNDLTKDDQTPPRDEMNSSAAQELAEYLRRTVDAANVQNGFRANAHGRVKNALVLLQHQLRVNDKRNLEDICNQRLADLLCNMAGPVTTAIERRNAAVTQGEFEHADAAVHDAWTTLARDVRDLIEQVIPPDPPKIRSYL